MRRRQWHPTPVLLPGKPHGWRSMVGYSPWGRKESDTTEQLLFFSPSPPLLLLLPPAIMFWSRCILRGLFCGDSTVWRAGNMTSHALTLNILHPSLLMSHWSNQFILQEIWDAVPPCEQKKDRGIREHPWRQPAPQRDFTALQHFLLTFAQLSGSQGSLSRPLCVKLQPCPPTSSPLLFFLQSITHTHRDTYLSASASPCQNVSPNRDKLSTFAEGPTWLPTPTHISILKD